MKYKKPEIGWTIGYFENDQPRAPRTKEESQYLDTLIAEHTKDEAYAGEFAQFVIGESQRFDWTANGVTGKLVARLAKKLAKEAQKLITRIGQGRSYEKQLVSVAFDFGTFCMVVEARSGIKLSTLRMSSQKKEE